MAILIYRGRFIAAVSILVIAALVVVYLLDIFRDGIVQNMEPLVIEQTVSTSTEEESGNSDEEGWIRYLDTETGVSFLHPSDEVVQVAYPSSGPQYVKTTRPQRHIRSYSLRPARYSFEDSFTEKPVSIVLYSKEPSQSMQAWYEETARPLERSEIIGDVKYVRQPIVYGPVTTTVNGIPALDVVVASYILTRSFYLDDGAFVLGVSFNIDHILEYSSGMSTEEIVARRLDESLSEDQKKFLESIEFAF